MTEERVDNIDDLGEDEGWPDSVSYDFAKARAETLQRTLHSDFAELQRELKALERAFVGRAGNNEACARNVRRQITEELFEYAIHFRKQSFETCKNLWHELLEYGFVEIERKCHLTWSFAECCLEHRQVDTGLGVLEPVIAELEGLVADPAVTEHAAEYYREQIGHLGEVRVKLEALRT